MLHPPLVGFFNQAAHSRPLPLLLGPSGFWMSSCAWKSVGVPPLSTDSVLISYGTRATPLKMEFKASGLDASLVTFEGNVGFVVLLFSFWCFVVDFGYVARLLGSLVW